MTHLKNKIVLALTFTLLLVAFAEAQEVSTITYSDLQARIKNGKDTTYLVNFWATWCAPCIKEMPHFDKLQKDYSHLPLKVVFMSLDFITEKDRVEEFLQKRKFASEAFLVSRKSDQAFIEEVDKGWEGAIPATLIINNGNSVRKFFQKEFSYEELENTYQSLK